MVFTFRVEPATSAPGPRRWQWWIHRTAGDSSLRIALVHLFTGATMADALLAADSSRPRLLLAATVTAAGVLAALFVVIESSVRRVMHAARPEPGPHPDGDWMPR